MFEYSHADNWIGYMSLRRPPCHADKCVWIFDFDNTVQFEPHGVCVCHLLVPEIGCVRCDEADFDAPSNEVAYDALKISN